MLITEAIAILSSALAAHGDTEIMFQLRDSDPPADTLGTTSLDAIDIIDGEVVMSTYIPGLDALMGELMTLREKAEEAAKGEEEEVSDEDEAREGETRSYQVIMLEVNYNSTRHTNPPNRWGWNNMLKQRGIDAMVKCIGANAEEELIDQ